MMNAEAAPVAKPYVVEVRCAPGAMARGEFDDEKEAFGYLRQVSNRCAKIPAADIFKNGKRVFGQSASRRHEDEVEALYYAP